MATKTRLWLLGMLMGCPGALPMIGACILLTLPLLRGFFPRCGGAQRAVVPPT
jgi:hypothetical protein